MDAERVDGSTGPRRKGWVEEEKDTGSFAFPELFRAAAAQSEDNHAQQMKKVDRGVTD